jgi:hypothetical protein
MPRTYENPRELPLEKLVARVAERLGEDYRERLARVKAHAARIAAMGVAGATPAKRVRGKFVS